MDLGTVRIGRRRPGQKDSAPVELLVGQPVMHNGRGRDEHGSGDGDGKDVTVVHTPVIDHMGASGQETGRMTDPVVRLPLASPADNDWARP